jgi:hypothetical protein
MDPIIYQITHSDKKIKMDKDIYQTDKDPSLPLIQYGYMNNITELNHHELINMISENKHDPKLFDLTLKSIDLHLFNEEKPKKFKDVKSLSILQVIEILFMVNKLDSDELKIRLPKHLESSIPVIESYLGIKLKSANNPDFCLISLEEQLDEVNTLKFIMNDNLDLIKSLKLKSSLAIKFGSIMTHPTVKYIYYLISHFATSYIVKPLSSNSIVNESYVVMLNLQDTIEPISYPLNSHLIDLFPGMYLPIEFKEKIQKFNGHLLDFIFSSYYEAHQYISERNYYGPKYILFTTYHKELIAHWFQIYESKFDMAYFNGLMELE